ncbi:hypothetical protein FA13DRAFT_235416 [Coprinellus micaceus]|uniref:Uncharacterized protein n=1 Tax=Coprinellus micaceus TaxID=71717 RepID=A0A4Y7SFG1_COPMI|nr:hypothetical protein FA13DRAFT_235416 [Coprinellus micaceus]
MPQDPDLSPPSLTLASISVFGHVPCASIRTDGSIFKQNTRGRFPRLHGLETLSTTMTAFSGGSAVGRASRRLVSSYSEMTQPHELGMASEVMYPCITAPRPRSRPQQ